MKQKTYVLGTNNRKKGLELQELLLPCGIELKTLSDFNRKLDVVEDGTTFAENARKKASEQAKFLDQWVIAEDSGICVDALKGSPGIFSARFSGENGNDDMNNELLLEKLADVPRDLRTAYYTCYAAVASPDGTIVAESQGFCRGLIRHELHGSGGFGYDPLFEIVEYHKTFGELDPTVKQLISHRSRAIRSLIPMLVGGSF